MNFFVENPETATEWGIIDFTHETPSGYEQSSSRPAQFIGRRYDIDGNQDCCHNNTVYHFAYYTTHFFFARTGHGYTPSILGTGCNSNPCNSELLGYLEP